VPATGAIYLTVLACNVASFVLKSLLFNIFLDMVSITSYLRLNHRSQLTAHTDLSRNRKSCYLKWSLVPSLIDLVPRARTHLTPHTLQGIVVRNLETLFPRLPLVVLTYIFLGCSSRLSLCASASVSARKTHAALCSPSRFRCHQRRPLATRHARTAEDPSCSAPRRRRSSRTVRAQRAPTR
jgi:hypothetical protein